MSQLDPASRPPPVPVPVQPLAYSAPWQQNRPGLITAIGVMCIVVACLSGLANLSSAAQGLIFGMFSVVSPKIAASSTASVSYSSSQAANEKLTVGEAGVADNALRSMLSLDLRRQHELDKLLRSHGRAILGGADDAPLTAAGIRQAVTQYKAAEQPTDAVQFTTELGQVEVYPDRAVFTSSDGTQTITTSAVGNSESQSVSSSFTGGQSGSVTQSTILTQAQLQQVMSAVKRRSLRTLNSAQLSSLRSELSAPSQQLVTTAGPSAVMNVMPQGNNVMIQFDGGMLTLGPQGQIVQMLSYGSAASGVGMPNFSRAAVPAAVMAIESLASLALAIYLLVVGILVFRASFKSPKLLRTYAWLKIPLALLGGAVSVWFWNQLMTAATSFPGSSRQNPILTFAAVWGAVTVLLGIAFPIALLIALRTKTVREYYSTIAAT